MILVSLRLDPPPMQRAEAVLHELGHRMSPTLLGWVGDCSPWQIAKAMSRPAHECS